MRRLVLVTAFFLGACSGGGKAYIPVDSPLRTWEPPESDEYAAEPAAPPPAPPAPDARSSATGEKDKKAEKHP